jgi:1,4-alpha-glucan branching enzyme
VRQFLRDNALMWLTEYHIDGLRWDSTINIRTVNDGAVDLPEGWSLAQWINDEIYARFPWKISIAEDLRNNAWLTRDAGGGGAGYAIPSGTRVLSIRCGKHSLLRMMPTGICTPCVMPSAPGITTIALNG